MMNKLNFVKYSGNGNDFVIFQGKVNLTSQVIQKICHRNFGIGADGVMVLETSEKADARMRIFNADFQLIYIFNF